MLSAIAAKLMKEQISGFRAADIGQAGSLCSYSCTRIILQESKIVIDIDHCTATIGTNVGTKLKSAFKFNFKRGKKGTRAKHTRNLDNQI